MATIDNLNLEVYKNYAVWISLSEQINTQLKLSEAVNVQSQISMVDLYPKLSDLDLVLGVANTAYPFAYFYPPKRFRDLRRNPFSFFRIAPSFGSLAKQDEDELRLERIVCSTPSDIADKEVIHSCLKEMGKINDMISYIIGRVGQFLQG